MVSDGLVKISKVRTSVPSVSIPKASQGVPHVPSGIRNRKKLNINRQHAKSLADIVLGDFGTGTLQLQHTLEDAGLENLIGHPILGRIAGYAQMTKERTFEPLINGELGKVMINTLESAGDTLDVLANPVKSLLPVAGGGTGEDFMKSMGWIEGEYRKTYQWDTGNFFLDLAGEMISDPINWFTWGSNAIQKQAGKTALNTMDDYLGEIYMSMKGSTQKEYLKDILDAMPQGYKSKIEKAFLEYIKSPASDDAIKVLKDTFDSLVELTTDAKSFNAAIKKIQRASDAGLFKSFQTIANVNNAAKQADTWLARVAWGHTPVGLSVIGVKHAAKPIKDSIVRAFEKKLKEFKFENPADVNKLSAKFEYLKQETIAKTVAYTDATKSAIMPVLEQHDLTYHKATNLYLDMVTNAGPGNRTYQDLKLSYKKQLESMMPGVYIAEPEDKIWARIETTRGTKNLLETSPDIIKLSVPVQFDNKNISVVIPSSLYSDFFYNISGLGNTLFYGSNTLMTESVNLFKSELNRYFSRTTAHLEFESLKQVAKESGLSVEYLKDVMDKVYNLNKSIRGMKDAAFDAISKAQLDLQSKSLLWNRLRDPDIMTQLVAYKDIYKITKSAPFKEAYDSLTNLLSTQMATLGDTNVDVYLNKILSTYNDLKAVMKYNNSIKLTPIENILDYIDNGFLRLDNKLWHLNNLDEFLNYLNDLEYTWTKKLQPGSDKFKYMSSLAQAKRTYYLTVLDYFGIRPDNSFALSELLRSRDKEALDKIHILLEQGKTGRRAVSSVVDKYSDSAIKSYSKAMEIPSTHKEVSKVIDKMPDKELLEASQEYDRLLKINAKSLSEANEKVHKMLISNVNVSGMNQLEILAKATGIDLIEFDDLWRTLKEYDYTNIDIETYKEIINQCNKLMTMIDSMEEVLQLNNKSINETLYAFFADLRNMNDAINIPDVTNSILEQMTIEETLYEMLLSRESMYHIINENVFNNLQAEYKPWIDALKDPNSPTRIGYNALTRAIKESGQDRAAESLGNFLLKLDTHTAVNRLLKFDVTGKFIDFDKHTADFIKALPYNTIAQDTYKNMLAVNLYTHPKTIVDAIMKDIESYRGKEIMDSIMERMVEVTNTDAYIMKDAARYGIQIEFVDALPEPSMLGLSDYKANKISILKNVSKEQAIKNLGVNTDSFIKKVKGLVQDNEDAKLLTYLHEISHFQNKDVKKVLDLSDKFREIKARTQSLEYLKALKNADELYKLEMNNLRANVYIAIKSYLNSILEAESELGLMNTKVYSILDAQTIDNFRYIANYQDDILKALGSKELEIDVKTELSLMTDLVYGKEMEHNIKANLDAIRQSSGKDFEDFFQRGDYNTVASAFYDSLRLISQENYRLAGAMGDMKDITKIQNLLTKSELNQTIRDLGQHTNFYDWSISNRYISSVKVFDAEYAAMQGIQPNKAIRVKSNEDYLKFYNAYRMANDRARYIMGQYNKETLESVKAALIHTYNYPSAIGAPVNATTYFGMLDVSNPNDALKLVTWDGLSRMSDLSSENKRRFTKYLGEKFDMFYSTGTFIQQYDRAEFFKNPWKWYEAVDAATSETNIIDIDAISDLINLNPPVNVLEDLYMRVDYNISTLCKDPGLLLESKIHYTNYINDDLAARKRLNYLTEFQEKVHTKPKKGKSEYIVKNFKDLTDLEKAQFAEAGLKPGDNMYEYKGQIYMKNQVDNDLLQTVLRSNASGVRAMLDHNNSGAMFVFAEGDYPFKATQEELAEWGVLAFKKDDDLWVLRRTDNEVRANQITWQVSSSAFQEGRNVVKRLLDDNSIYLNLDDMNVPAHLLTGDMVDTDFWEYLKTSELFIKELGDEGIQKTYINLTKEGLDNFYKKNYSRPQMLVFGIDGYNRLIDYVERHNDGPMVHFRRKSTRLDSAVSSGMMDVIVRHNRETKLMSLFFNDEYFLGNQTFTRALADTSDAKLKEFFKKGNYVAAIIREDSKGRPRVHRFPISNRKHLNEAIEMGAHVFTEEIFRNMSLTINSHTIDNRALKIYRQLIVGGFKSIWLTSPGALFRNFVDSSVMKNATELGGIDYLMDAFKYEYQAGKLLDFYDKIQREVFKRTGGQTFNREVLTNVLNSLPARDRELYYLTDVFVNSGASGGLSASFEQFLLQFNKAASGNVEQLWEDTVSRMLFEGTYSPVRIVMDLNSKIEQTARYGLFLGLINQGEGINSALQHVIKTHFDYVYKTGAEDILEQIFWFITFPINNILYYVNEGLERNPTMLKMLLDANELSWNDGEEYTYDALKDKPQLQYHAITGNIRFRTNDGKKDIIIKIGPSLFDFIQFMINPAGSFKERLNPFLAVLTGQEGLSELNPINSQIGRAQQIMQGKSILPSIYTTWNVKEFLRPEYKSYQKSSWNFKTKPVKGRRVKPGSKNYIAYRSRQHWVKRTYLPYNRWNNRYMKPITYEPYWDPASNKYRGTFNRQRRLYAKLPKPNTLDYTQNK